MITKYSLFLFLASNYKAIDKWKCGGKKTPSRIITVIHFSVSLSPHLCFFYLTWHTFSFWKAPCWFIPPYALSIILTLLGIFFTNHHQLYPQLQSSFSSYKFKLVDTTLWPLSQCSPCSKENCKCPICISHIP